MASKTEQRAKDILHLLLQQQGKTTVEELADALATSSASIRRDLVRLEAEGLVHRTRGGAMLAAGQTYEPFRFDASFKEREERFPAEKLRIAAAAARLVEDGETIGITAGTTTTQVARSLSQRGGLQILTNAVNIGVALSGRDGLEVTLTGGCIRWPGAFSLVGPAALETVQLTMLSKVFLSVCGISPQHGATTIQAEEAAIFRAMSRQARQVIVVADSSKVGMRSPAVICPIRNVHTLITDDGIPSSAIEGFRQSGTHLIIAK